MKRILKYLLMSALAAALLCACHSNGKVIPKNTLARIYEEMFLTDQWVASAGVSQRGIDTTLLYEPIFNKYGYTSKDYQTTLEYYIMDPDKFARVLRKTSSLLDDRAALLKTRKVEEDAIRNKQKGIDRWRPEITFSLTDTLEGPCDTTYIWKSNNCNNGQTQ